MYRVFDLPRGRVPSNSRFHVVVATWFEFEVLGLAGIHSQSVPFESFFQLLQVFLEFISGSSCEHDVICVEQCQWVFALDVSGDSVQAQDEQQRIYCAALMHTDRDFEWPCSAGHASDLTSAVGVQHLHPLDILLWDSSISETVPYQVVWYSIECLL
ncbi:hypothetical protein WR25_03481 [Diploscapter pachys]|uniref:Uncharacterized protein n=1 Tax=Diploscapter pachys TaxID=2018661 RepID=A0A2A2LAS3_9BILA|nr:hypothetical protein WR25_03481 [Diploscapter pachys]